MTLTIHFPLRFTIFHLKKGILNFPIYHHQKLQPHSIDITRTCLVAVINCDVSIQTDLFCANFPLVQSTSTEKGGGVKMDSPIFS